VAKVTRNRERDQEVWRRLEAKGWNVIIAWECELKKGRIEETVERVAGEIVRNGKAYHLEQEERQKAREEYRHERKALKEKEQALLGEVALQQHPKSLK
jgi:DNA mismatch endonuclease (patch repair protein)